jgi:hypothetical protein
MGCDLSSCCDTGPDVCLGSEPPQDVVGTSAGDMLHAHKLAMET